MARRLVRYSPSMASSHAAVSDASDTEGHIECLRACLQNLPADNRELIVEYYQGEKGAKIKNRKRLIERLGIPVNTLRMRVQIGIEPQDEYPSFRAELTAPGGSSSGFKVVYPRGERAGRAVILNLPTSILKAGCTS